MQLIVILLATVSILTILSGIIVFFGSRKKDRARSIWFLLAAIFATIWMVSISLFLVSEDPETANWHIIWGFISAIMLDVAFLGYTGWSRKYGRILTIVFLVFGGVVSGLIALFPYELYHDVVLSSTGNGISMVMGPLYFSYIGFFSTIVPAIIFVYFKQFLSSTSERRVGDIITMAAYGISSLVILICDLILPMLGNWGMSWLGPLALAITIISIYYTILRYRMVSFKTIWLKIFSYVVIVASIAIVYMLIFSAVFAALFKGSSPSIQVIVLNFIMVIIFLALTPVINNIMVSVRLLGDYHHNSHSKEQGDRHE